jgi:signal transduction protein with GAF and PtsI domain
MNAKGCALRLLDEKREILELSASYGLSEKYLSKGPVELARAPLDADVIHGEVVDIADVSKEKRILYPEESAREGIRSMSCVPVRVKDRIIGVLRVYRSEPHKSTPEEISMALTLAAREAISSRNSGFARKGRLSRTSLRRSVRASIWTQSSRALSGVRRRRSISREHRFAFSTRRGNASRSKPRMV